MLIHLIKLHTWLREEGVAFIDNLPVTINQEMIIEAQEYLRQKQEAFTRKARLKRFNQPEARVETNEKNQPLKKWSSTEEGIKEAQAFLSFCQEWLEKQNNQEHFLSFLALHYLIDSRSSMIPLLPEKIGVLFTLLIAADEELAHQFYQEHAQTLSALTAKTMIADKCAVSIEIKRIQTLLAHEKNPLGILLLCREFLLEPPKLTALILYFLQQGMSTEALIQSRILRDFLACNLFNLKAEDSAVRKLYTLLGQFDIAGNLIEQVSRCVIQIPNYPVFYTLDGLETQDELSPVEIQDTLFEFTINNDNFTNLYTLFGNPFLVAAFNWLARDKENSLLKQQLIQVINYKNESCLTLEDIAGLINTVAKDTPNALEVLAEIIKDNTIEKLLCAHVGAVFYLAPFKPIIVNTLKEISCLQAYISDLTAAHYNVYDSIGQLISLLKQFNNQNDILYNTILKLVIEKSSLQETEVLDYLKTHASKYDRQLKNRMKALSKELNKSIDDQLLSTNEFTLEACKIVEDYWHMAVREFEVLNQLVTKDSDYPADKYAFLAYLIKKLVEKKQFDINLQDFLNNMLLSSTETIDHSVTEFERALIEILTAVDDPTIRNSAIKLLESTPRKNQRWCNYSYGSKSIFARIGSMGNLGLLIYLLEQGRYIDGRAISDLMNEATTAGHLDIIQYICSLKDHNKPSANNVIELLKLALTSQKIDIVQYLCTLGTDNKPNVKAISELVMDLTENQKWDALKLLCTVKSENKPDANALSTALTSAAYHQQWNLVQAIFANRTCVINVTAASKWATLHQKWDILSVLTAPQSDNNSAVKANSEKPDTLINPAKPIRAASQRQTSNSPNSREELSIQLKSAAYKKQWDVILSLSITNNNKPSDEAIFYAIKQATHYKAFNIVHYLYELTTPDKPDQDLSHALNLAAANQHWETVQYFCTITTANKPKVPSITKALKKLSDSLTSPDFTEKKKAYLLKLLHHIDQLYSHGKTLAIKSPEDSEKVTALTERLAQTATLYFLSQHLNPNDTRTPAALKEQFQLALYENAGSMGNHRELWKPILANIAIAATGIGLIALVVQFVTTGTGFFAQTQRKKTVNEIDRGFYLLTLT